MDAALQAMLSGHGSGGGMRLFCAIPDIDSGGLETLAPIGQLTMEELLKKLIPLMNQALIFNFPGGFIFRTFIQKILEILKQHIDMTAGVGGGHSVSSIGSPGPGGGGGGSSELSH